MPQWALERSLRYKLRNSRQHKRTLALTGMVCVLHIVSRKDWENANTAGSYRPGSLAAEGFIHCSTVGQAVRTVNTFYKGIPELSLLCIDEAKLAAPCRWEDPAEGPGHSEEGEKFPHIYGPLNLDAVIDVVEFPCGQDWTVRAAVCAGEARPLGTAPHPTTSPRRSVSGVARQAESDR